MLDFTNFEKINDEAYVWRGFLSSEICDDAFKESISLTNHPDRIVREIDSVQLLGGAMDERIVDKVNEFFKGTGFFTGSFLHWYTDPGVWFAAHRDDEAFDPTPFKKTWAGVIYLADMDGGELLYPTYNTFVVPRKGDLVIHTAVLPHAATPVSTTNKRTVTFVVYDESNPIDPNIEPYGEKVAAKKDKQIYYSKDWLDSHFGKMWMRDYNVTMEQIEKYKEAEKQ